MTCFSKRKIDSLRDADVPRADALLSRFRLLQWLLPG
jgi:hypothetical protein